MTKLHASKHKTFLNIIDPLLKSASSSTVNEIGSLEDFLELHLGGMMS